MGLQDVQWGRYQAGTSVLMALLKMPAAWFQLSLLFLAPNVNFRCAQPFNNSSADNASDTSLAGVWDDSCSYRDEAGTRHRCDRWLYDRQEFTATVNTMWDLVCDQEMLVTWAQVTFMSGVLSGNALGGLLANRVGHKPVLVVSVLLQPLLSAVVAVVPWFSLFLTFRFLLGLSLGGTMVVSFALGAELGSGPYRPVITILHMVPFGMGQTLLGLTAYFLRDWRQIQMALSIYCLIFLPYCWLVEESPKWLLASGRLRQAESVMAVIRQRNGQPMASLTEMDIMTDKHSIQIVKVEQRKMNKNTARPEVSFCDLFRSPRLRQYTLSVWLMWYCAGLSFFAMNAYQTQLGGNSMLNLGVGGLIGGIPGNILTIFLVRRFGRKKIIIIAHLLVALCAILIPVYDVGEAPEDWPRRLLGLFTLMAMSVAFPAMFLLSGELLPGVLRASAMGVANLMGRLGNTTAPLVGTTAKFHRWLPLCIIAAAPLLTVLLMTTLPDTSEGSLPETVQDIENTDRLPKKVVVAAEEDGKIYKPVSVQES